MSHAADEELARRLAQEEEDSQLAQTLARELAIQGTAADVVSAGILGGGGIGGDFGTDVDGLVSGASPSSGNSNGGSKSHGMLNRLSRVLGKQPRRNSYEHSGSDDMESNNSLLYVPCEIKGRMTEMMVDSGSQTSVISSSMMYKLQLKKALDVMYQGTAAGVGSARILGRIDNCPVLIGAGVEFRLYFLVLDVPHDMIILGIDQMRRFQCLIDLQNNVLIFGGRGGLEVPFLPPDTGNRQLQRKSLIDIVMGK